MVNESELFLNIVRYKEPKMLTGSDQNGKQSDNLLNFGVTRTLSTAGGIVTYAEHGKPVSLLSCGTGKQAVRRAERGAGIGLRKKRMPLCNGADRSCNITPRETGQTSALGDALQNS